MQSFTNEISFDDRVRLIKVSKRKDVILLHRTYTLLIEESKDCEEAELFKKLKELTEKRLNDLDKQTKG